MFALSVSALATPTPVRTQTEASLGVVGIFSVQFLFAAYFLRSSAFSVPLPLDLLCYAGLAIAICFHFVQRGNQINVVATVGVLALGLSLIGSLNPQISIVRWCAWAMLVAGAGGLFIGPEARKYRMYAVQASLCWLHAMTLGSFLVYFAGIQLNGRGFFWGVMGHSQILGAVASLSALDALRRALLSGKHRWLVFFALAVTVALLASSRAALLGLGVGAIPITKMSGGRGHFLAAIVFAAGVFGYFFFLQEENVQSLLRVQSNGVVAGVLSKGSNHTRESLWSERLEEFRSAPVFGIGYALGGRATKGFADNTLLEEPGTSYLAVLSTTGLAGALGLLLLATQLFWALQRNWQRIPRDVRIFIASWGMFWLAHLAFEGYILSVGSLFCLIFWTFIAFAFDAAATAGWPQSLEQEAS